MSNISDVMLGDSCVDYRDDAAFLSRIKNNAQPDRGMNTAAIMTATTATTTATTATTTRATAREQKVCGSESQPAVTADNHNDDALNLHDLLVRVDNVCTSRTFVLNKDYTRLLPKKPKNEATIDAMTRFFELRSELENFDPSHLFLYKAQLTNQPLDRHTVLCIKDDINKIKEQVRKLSDITNSMYVNLKEIRKDADPRVKNYTKLTLTTTLMQVLNIALNTLVTVAFILISPVALVYYSAASGASSAAINTYKFIKNRGQTNKVNEWDELEAHFLTLGRHLSEMEGGSMLSIQQKIVNELDRLDQNSVQNAGRLIEVERIVNTSNEISNERLEKLEEQNKHYERQNAEMKRQMDQMKSDFLTFQIASLAAQGGIPRHQYNEIPRFAVPQEYRGCSSSAVSMGQTVPHSEPVPEQSVSSKQ